MAKYCSKCGRALPEGVEICPNCHAEGQEQGAALFTQMTAETEVWKETDKPGKKLRRKPGAKERAILYSAAVLLMAITALVVWFTLPASRVKRAVKAGDYDKAIAIYSDRLMGRGKSSDGSIGALLEEKARETCAAFEARELGESEAERVFTILYAFGLNTKAIDGQYAAFSALKDTKRSLDEAERLILSERYLEACELLRSIPEGDAAYDGAQARAQECLELYAALLLTQAENRVGAGDYAGAIALLEEGEAELIAHGTYASAIDGKISECYERYEAYALEEAENLARLDSYGGAASLLASCMETVGETETLREAYERYSTKAEEQTAAETIARSNGFYAAGQVEEAFRELESALERSEDGSELREAVAALEARYAADTIARAREVLDGDREKLDDALDVLAEAQELRELEAIGNFAEALESYRPLLLAEADYDERSGEIYRSATDFEALDGTVYTGGWIWGANEAGVSYTLGGGYDVLEGVLAVRRDDEAEISGYFELWCDGELVYTSPTLEHDGEPLRVSCPISGCQSLRLVFYCDYETSTANDGFCYHGLCQLRALRYME